MDSRVEDILAFVEPMYNERFLDSCKQIQADYSKNHRIITLELFSAIENLAALGIRQQEQGLKDRIQFLSFSCLRSELATGTGGIRLDLYDRNFFCDLCETDGYWIPGFLQPYFCSDVDALQKRAQRKFVRMRAFEADAIRNYYSHYYFSIILKMLEDLIEEIITLPKLESIQKDEEFLITFGMYMDKGAIIWPREELTQ